jgi:hypothetical protein
VKTLLFHQFQVSQRHGHTGCPVSNRTENAHLRTPMNGSYINLDDHRRHGQIGG